MDHHEDGARKRALEPADLFLSSAGPGGTWTQLVRLGSGASSPGSGENCQMLSPDGRHLFFTRDGDIYWVDAVVIEKTRSTGQGRRPIPRND